MPTRTDSRELLADPKNAWMCLSENGSLPLDPPSWLSGVVAERLPDLAPLDQIEPTTQVYAVTAFLDAVQTGTGLGIVTALDTGAHRQIVAIRSDEVAAAFDASEQLEPDDTWYLIVLTPTDQLPSTPDTEQSQLPVRLLRSKLDASGRRLWIDESNVERLLGWQPDTLLGKSTVDQLHPDDRERTIAAFTELLARPGGQSRVRHRIIRADGQSVWLESTYTNLLHTEDPHVAVDGLDVSAEMAAQVELEARENLLTELTEALPVGVLHLDSERQPTIANTAWRTLTGTTAGGFESLTSVVAEPERVIAIIDHALEAGEHATLPVQFQSPTAVCQHGEVHIRPLEDTSGKTATLITLTDTTEAVALQVDLGRLALLDHLTQVPNRLGLESELDAALNSVPESVTLLFIDVNDFKRINDDLGHATGDTVLIEVAEAIRSTLRSSDVVARIGGDEFAVLLLGANTAETEHAVQRVGERLDEVRARLNLPVPLSVSIGIAVSSEDDDFDSLLRRADTAMYRNKHGIDPAAS